MCKEGWCVGLGQEGVAWGGGTVWNTLKVGGTDFKKGSYTGSRGRSLKKGGAGTPLQTMSLKWCLGNLRNLHMMNFCWKG